MHLNNNKKQTLHCTIIVYATKGEKPFKRKKKTYFKLIN